MPAAPGGRDLVDWMHSLKAKTQRGRPTWNLRALRDIVRSDVYLGIASHGEFRKEDAHESLIDLGTWRRAQRNGVQTVSRSATPGLLTGLLRCAGCRYALTARTHRLKDDRVVHDYRCRCQSELAGSCPEPASASGAEGVHEWVVERFFERIEDVQVAAVSDDRVGDLQDARDRARDALNAYASDARIQATIGMDAYVTALQTRQEALETAQTALDAEQDSIDALSTTADVAALREDWPNLTVLEQRRLLALAIDCVFVRRRNGTGNGTGIPLAERAHICWRGEAPELPGKGRRNFAARPFLYPDEPLAGVALPKDRDVARGDGVAKLAV